MHRQDVQTISIGQIPIQDQDIAGVGDAPGFVTCHGTNALRLKTFEIQEVAESLPKVCFVLNDQDPQWHELTL